MKRVFFLLLACMLSNIMISQNYWTPEAGDFSDPIGITCVIQIDGVEQESDQLEVGAFCGDQCRGSRIAEYWEIPVPGLDIHRYVVYLQIFGNDGDAIFFKLYDHSIHKELNVSSPESLTWNENFPAHNEMDPYILNFIPLTSSYTLDITGYSEEQGNGNNWYLISTPVGPVNPAEIEGMTIGDFDLYYFNQSDNGAEWKNYESTPFSLEPCKGYLYAHSTNVTLNFGTEAYSGSGNVSLVKDDNANLAGWNLIGNPFGVTASIGRDFYVMNPEGFEIVPAETDQIAPMQGIFVIAERDGEAVTFTPGASANDGNKLVINVAQNRSSVIDRAIVRFGQGNQLPKFMLNDNNTKLYIPQADNDYAVVRSDNEAELPLNFKAAANGTYILKVDANTTEMDYLHLVDNKTGNDIDLLENPSYTFEASATDFANRFKLVLRNTTSIDENTNFAFYNGLDWTVNNEGKSTLQVVDMTGRIVSTETIDGTAHVTINAAPGAYMLQLTNGNDVKTQKVVIK